LQKIDRDKLMNNFVSRTAERRALFGHSLLMYTPGLEVRRCAPVSYTGTSLVGLKSYRHLFLADCHTVAVHEISSVDHREKSLKLLRFLSAKYAKKCVCGPLVELTVLPRPSSWILLRDGREGKGRRGEEGTILCHLYGRLSGLCYRL